ncbi:nuclear transport factor 2 family protein [Streptococcus ovuberis]|uniref:Nuclear transport factor 2 family protein n=1 Tax=Streptococcus ovuberis TaxID=1936207 RepID=A0A7X6MWS1_9STRE|nr:nuclear transport factor 2 family protein [Streptococcus ovuberis]NKZ19800.1 nuclear transport factor 2 family protein [Streptococcus ovuberis]
MSQETLAVFHKYNDALRKGDFPAVFATMADDIIWHQPGQHSTSGTVVGKEKLGQHLAQFSVVTNGTFKVLVNWVSDNRNLVAANVTFLGEKDGQKLDMNGIDLFRIEDGLIREVWLFSSQQDLEDAFWG